MDTDGKRQQVNFEQLTTLLDFLKEHQELAKGLTRGRRGKVHTLKIWNLCAKKLNAVKDGATKDGKDLRGIRSVVVFKGLPESQKYWCDWKYRVRRRALELKAAKDSNRQPPDGIVPLSNMEETILSIIGDSALNGVIIKSDPLADGNTEEDEPDNDNDDVSTNRYYGTRSSSRIVRKRRRSCKEQNTSDQEEIDGPSSPLDKKPRLSHERNGAVDDSDENDEATQFLRLAEEKLENSKRVSESLQSISSEIRRLADVMGNIRDILINNRINL